MRRVPSHSSNARVGLGESSDADTDEDDRGANSVKETSLSPESSCRRLLSRYKMAVQAFVILATLSFILLLLPSLIPTPKPGLRPSSTTFFLSLGDFGVGSSRQKAVARQMAATIREYRPRFIISLGDNFYPSGIKNLEDPLIKSHFEDIYIYPELHATPWFLALGDHDHCGNVSAQLAYTHVSKRWNMEQLFFTKSVDVGDGATLDIFFTDSISLEGWLEENSTARRFSEDYTPSWSGAKQGQAQAEWLLSALNGSTANWKIVVGHRPVLTAADRHDRFPAEAKFQMWLQSVLEENKVDVYINGHDHVGQHLEKNGTVYIGNGVGGYNSHPLKRDRSTVWAKTNYAGFILHGVTAEFMEFYFMDSAGRLLHTARIDKRRQGKVLAEDELTDREVDHII